MPKFFAAGFLLALIKLHATTPTDAHNMLTLATLKMALAVALALALLVHVQRAYKEFVEG